MDVIRSASHIARASQLSSLYRPNNTGFVINAAMRNQNATNDTLRRDKPPWMSALAEPESAIGHSSSSIHYFAMRGEFSSSFSDSMLIADPDWFSFQDRGAAREFFSNKSRARASSFQWNLVSSESRIAPFAMIIFVTQKRNIYLTSLLSFGTVIVCNHQSRFCKSRCQRDFFYIPRESMSIFKRYARNCSRMRDPIIVLSLMIVNVKTYMKWRWKSAINLRVRFPGMKLIAAPEVRKMTLQR